MKIQRARSFGDIVASRFESSDAGVRTAASAKSRTGCGEGRLRKEGRKREKGGMFVA